MTGKRAEAIAIVKELEEKYARKEATGRYVAAVYAGLGDKDKAFEWLEKDFQIEGRFTVVSDGQSHLNLSATTRDIKDLLKRMDLPE